MTTTIPPVLNIMLDDDSSLRGTADDPLVINHPERNYRLLQAANHVHNEMGVCVKNRFAVRCEPEPRDKVEEVIEFAKTHLGLELEKWQEDFLRAAITGRHTFEHKIRNRYSREWMPQTYGFFGSAKAWVDNSITPGDWEILTRPAFPFRSAK